MESAAEFLPRFFTLWDVLAASVFIVAWVGMTRLIEKPGEGRPSTHEIMAGYRMRWMEAMLRRDPRIVDAHLLGAMRNGAAFFASGCMIAIGGVVALLGQTERMVIVARDLTPDLEITRTAWEAKLLVLALVLVSAFMKFVWSHRLFGYCAVLIGAVTEDPEDPENQRIARKAGHINITAARNFNRGLRALYFSMAMLAWFLGAWAFIVATLLTAAMLHRREFRSESREALLDKR